VTTNHWGGGTGEPSESHAAFVRVPVLVVFFNLPMLE
jgi:hypothetical protein